MNQFKEVIDLLEEKGFQEISDVFIILKKTISLRRKEIFFNYYSKKISYGSREYYLRSSEPSFCITPYSRYKS